MCMSLSYGRLRHQRLRRPNSSPSPPGMHPERLQGREASCFLDARSHIPAALLPYTPGCTRTRPTGPATCQDVQHRRLLTSTTMIPGTARNGAVYTYTVCVCSIYLHVVRLSVVVSRVVTEGDLSTRHQALELRASIRGNQRGKKIKSDGLWKLSLQK